MAQQYSIEYLADYPQHIDACAVWHYTFWGIRSEKRSFQKSRFQMQNSAQKDSLPLTRIAIDNQVNVPVGMVSIRDCIDSYWKDFKPWVASLFVHEQYRGEGLAKQLMVQIEQDAIRLKVARLYLMSSTVERFYEKIGYQIHATREANDLRTGQETLFYKDLFL